MLYINWIMTANVALANVYNKDVDNNKAMTKENTNLN